MKVAALYDIHGNLPALAAVLRDVPEDAIILIGGDTAAGPMPAETLERLLALGDRAVWIRGNADRDGGVESELWRRRTDWMWEQLGGQGRVFLSGLPETASLTVDGLGETLFCHGSPRSDEEVITALTTTERLRAILADAGTSLVGCGHTHHQFDRRVDGVRVVNAGSVGMPYEGRTGAFWTLLGPDVERRRSEYDVEAASAAIRESGYPDPDELVETLAAPPTAKEAAEFLEQRALENETS
jgi:predicted phosphodiesterase